MQRRSTWSFTVIGIRSVGFGLLLLGAAVWLAPLDTAKAQEGEVMVVTGTEWQEMEEDQKVAFLAGIMQLVEFERQLAEGQFDPEQKSFVPLLAKGASGHSLGDVVVQLDTYYASNPDQSGKSVIHGLFETLVFSK